MQKRKTEKTSSDKPNSLYHYTSFDAVTQILWGDSAQKEKSLCFWFGNPLQTNDPREVHFFEEYVYDGVKGKALKQKTQTLQDKIGMPFILSLIHHKNIVHKYPTCEIPMWKMYGNNFEGVRLRFNFGKLNNYCIKNNINLIRCNYLSVSKMTEIAREIRRDSDDNKLENIYKEAVCYKTYDWSYENEWRLVAWNPDKDKIGFKSNGRLYMPVFLPIELLEAIEIGPKADHKAVEGTLDLIKSKLKSRSLFSDFKVVRSKLQIGYI